MLCLLLRPCRPRLVRLSPIAPHPACLIIWPFAYVMPRAFIITLAVVFAVVLLWMPAFMRARMTPSSNACINNLRQIDGAKQQWALEYSKSTNDVPRLADLRAYLGRGIEGQIPRCPAGGIYRVGMIGDVTRCSVPGHTI